MYGLPKISQSSLELTLLFVRTLNSYLSFCNQAGSREVRTKKGKPMAVLCEAISVVAVRGFFAKRDQDVAKVRHGIERQTVRAFVIPLDQQGG